MSNYQIVASSPFSLWADKRESVLTAADFFIRDNNGAGKSLYEPDFLLIHSHLRAISDVVEYYEDKINKIDPILINYLTPTQRQVMADELLYALNLIVLRLQHDVATLNGSVIAARAENLRLCAQLYDATVAKLKDGHRTPESALSRDKIACYVNGHYQSYSVKPEKVIDWMNDFNGNRLYWVWGGGLLESLMKFVPEDFHRKPQVDRALKMPGPILGYISWSLYFARFALNLYLLLRHTVRGPWMRKEEKDIPWRLRLRHQLNERKFTMLNDAIWGLINLASCFWLQEYWAGFFCAVLLMFDISMAIWARYETNQLHAKSAKNLLEDIKAKEGALERERLTGDKELVQRLETELFALKNMQQVMKMEWKQHQRRNNTNLCYTICIFLAYVVVCYAFLPAALLIRLTHNEMAPMIFAAAGAAMCFFSNMIYSAAAGGLEVSKAKEQKAELQQEFKALLEQFTVKKAWSYAWDRQQKQLYVQMKELAALIRHQERIQTYQDIRILRKIVLDLGIPPLIFSCFVFLPFMTAAGIVGTCFTLAFLSDLLLRALQPQAATVQNRGFDELEFKDFKTAPSLARLAGKPEPKSSSIFSFWSVRKGYQPVPDMPDLVLATGLA